MKLRMLSILSIVLALTIQSLDISAKDYHDFRVLTHAIPNVPYVPLVPPNLFESELDSLIHQLAQSDAIVDPFVSYLGEKHIEYKTYEHLKNIASENDLNQLLLHESPIVRVYAHKALVANQMNMNCDYELALLQDSTCVDWFNEEKLNNTTVSEMVQIAHLQ